MQALARGEPSDPGRPTLSTFVPADGVLRDVDRVEYQVREHTDTAPTPVFPAGGRAEAVRIGVGQYLAVYTPPTDAALGRYAVRWFENTGDDEVVFDTPFEVLAAPVARPLPGYCLIQDVRDEGFSPELASDARVARCIEFASRYIERMTGRFFEARRQTIELDGRGTAELQLDQPIIAVEALDEGRASIAGAQVYGRHLTHGLLRPDDREHPRLRVPAPRGHRNLRVTGLFGYTEPDGSPTGSTPRLIREACVRLVVRELPLLAEVGPREDARLRHRLVQEKTREQSYTLDRPRRPGPLTGDPDIDEILIQFMRPPGLGAA